LSIRLWRCLEAKLAVGGLAAALAAAALFVVEKEVDGGRGDGFLDVAAADAGAVRAVPVALDDHRAITSGADPGECRLHFLVILPPAATRGAFVKALTDY